MYRSFSMAKSTAKTYDAHLNAYLQFCSSLNICPVPLSQRDLGRYIAYISRRLAFTSVRQYLNIVRLLHLEAGLSNPLENNWYVNSILKGVRRIKGDVCNPKLPITPDILKGVFLNLDLKSSFDRTFWAACLVSFFSFFRKSNLLIQSQGCFDPSKNLCAHDVEFTLEGVVLSIRWSKVIQFQERLLRIPLPKICNSPFCPSTALLQMVLECPSPPSPVPLFRYVDRIKRVTPLTHQKFTCKLRDTLAKLGFPSEQYSGHSFRRGGASFALQCGLPAELIKLQGDWRSNSYERYLNPSFQSRLTVAQALGRAFSSENITAVVQTQ